MNRRAFSLAVARLLLFFVMAAVVCGSAVAQEAGKAKAAGKAKPKGRLPAYYAKIVDEEQRTKIYALQAEFAAKKEALRKQLEAIEAEEDTAIEGLLSPEQKQKLAALQEEAKAAREKKAGEKKAGSKKADDEKPAKKPAA
ncbi:MAG: hypothetical protein WD875_12575 [Pirellulales bacterium]